MPRKKQKVDTLEEIETNIKLLCDQSNNHMKVREYYKALTGYNQVNIIFDLTIAIFKQNLSKLICILS